MCRDNPEGQQLQTKRLLLSGAAFGLAPLAPPTMPIQGWAVPEMGSTE